MSEVWETLIEIQDRLIDAFDATGTEIQEPGMDRFNQPGWLNRVWSSDSYRRAHIDVVDSLSLIEVAERFTSGQEKRTSVFGTFSDKDL